MDHYKKYITYLRSGRGVGAWKEYTKFSDVPLSLQCKPSSVDTIGTTHARPEYVTLSAKTDHLGLLYNFQYACKLMGGAYFCNFR